MKNTWMKAIATVMAATLTLSGCGSETAKKNEQQTAPAAQETTASTDAADDLDRILAAGVITIGTEGTWPPMTYHDEAGELTGFDVEVAKAIAEKLGVKAEFVETDWDSLIAGLGVGRFDIIVNEVTPTEERKQTYDFSDPYTYVYDVVITKEDNNDISTMEDLKGKKTSNTISSTHAQIAESYGAEVIAVDTFEASIEMVLQGRADATINGELVFNDYITQKPDSGLKIAAYNKEAISTAIPVRKGQDRLREAINKALEELKNDGTFNEISMRYFGKDITQPINE
jgi:cystine transport system substrate-binding protein